VPKPPLPPQCQAKMLSRKQEETIRVALLSGYTRDQAAEMAGITRRRLDTRLRDQLRDVRVGQGRRERERRYDDDPTPEQIAERAAAIRAEWTPEIEQERRVNFSGQRPEV
jgi:hypothetical protein